MIRTRNGKSFDWNEEMAAVGQGAFRRVQHDQSAIRARLTGITHEIWLDTQAELHAANARRTGIAGVLSARIRVQK